ncbi:MAG: hydantoinase/oxoprolinase family protein [Marvinbryantia sp.]|uniref:hydantoinase/oxoprolinase family protein n=1 Tax=Marvinbryantia sp. TaxID=2496532 RepID=UPI0025E76252|nr:hydantoinase/oxoprolinase family protein [uncultured Marvinbryantia sp.]
MKVRIGIDVGGTFTDAALINNDTFELISTVKVPTTHSDKAGVAAGIVQVLQAIMEENNVRPEDVAFISHGTTQATNALLEGDVVRVGIVTIGKGIEGTKSKSDTLMGDIPLTAAKSLHSENEYVEGGTDLDRFCKDAAEAVLRLKNKGCEAVVAAEAFSVDHPENEAKVSEICRENGMAATATNEISKLYGLKVRTRTAVVNASIMPKMLDAATMTETSIKRAGIKTPLMVMRCDGGVMTVEEVRKRPILTILSGPAAGVAGALMYEKLTNGIFLEVGGTSTDISCVKDGKVMVKYAEIGGHKTYLTSLDVRTVGIGGGSMMQIERGRLVDVGPRSVHIAGLAYEVYSNSEEIVEPVLHTVKPSETDPDYGYVQCSNGKKFALSLAGAANLAGYVPEGDYARGSIEAARKAWQPLADSMGMSVEDTAREALRLSALKNRKVVEGLIEDYGMDTRTLVLVGGGGGASSVVPHLAEAMGLKHKNAKNAPVISTIGVALAMIRDTVERTIANPTQEDILSVRREAEERAIQSGASPETVEVSVEVDTSKNMVRAIAIGTTELRSKDLTKRKLTEEEIRKIAAEHMDAPENTVYTAVSNGMMYAMQHKVLRKKFFGVFKSVTKPTVIVDEEGVVRLQKKNGKVYGANGDNWESVLLQAVENMTEYNDGGKTMPNTYVIFGKRILDLSGLLDEAQIKSLAEVELAAVRKDDTLMILTSARTD